MEHIRYSVAACQTDMSNPVERRQMRSNTDRMLNLVDAAVAGSAPFLPVRLVVFPEFAHAAPVFATVAELLEKRYQKFRRLGVFSEGKTVTVPARV